MQLYFATTNKGKIASLQHDMKGLDVEVVPMEMEIPEVRSDVTVEFALGKFLYYFPRVEKNPCMALDGGFYIPSLNGFPKAYVNFALSTIGLEGILKLVEGKNRACEFRDTIAYLDDRLSEPVICTSIVRGTLAAEPRGELKPYNWGALHKIFIPDGWSKTFTEMTEDEMNRWRGEHAHEWCGAQLARWLQEYRLK